MTWFDRAVKRLHAEPVPFDCLWCTAPPRGEGRHDLCTGTALRAHKEGPGPAVGGKCACALREHDADLRRGWE